MSDMIPRVFQFTISPSFAAVLVTPDGRHAGCQAYVGLGVWLNIGPDDGLLVGLDVGLDIGLDVGLDIGLDVGLDIGLDVGLDIGLDVGLDIGLDVGLDIGFDVGLDIGLDTTLLCIPCSLTTSLCVRTFARLFSQESCTLVTTLYRIS